MQRGTHSTRLIRFWILLLPLILAAGCAVVTVDVDVYKGALANQRDVQVKQLAAMTMAAKPVLTALQTQLLKEIEKVQSDSKPSKADLSKGFRQRLLLTNVVVLLTL